jgi:hypothetical protein
MSAKPTPGPLIVRVGANGDVGIIATSQATAGLDIGGALVAEVFADIRRPLEGARGEALANATLFAAAHDLLEALEEARTGLLWYQDRHPGSADGSDDEAMARIDAAIAKANGRTS